MAAELDASGLLSDSPNEKEGFADTDPVLCVFAVVSVELLGPNANDSFGDLLSNTIFSHNFLSTATYEKDIQSSLNDGASEGKTGGVYLHHCDCSHRH